MTESVECSAVENSRRKRNDSMMATGLFLPRSGTEHFVLFRIFRLRFYRISFVIWFVIWFISWLEETKKILSYKRALLYTRRNFVKRCYRIKATYKHCQSETSKLCLQSLRDENSSKLKRIKSIAFLNCGTVSNGCSFSRLKRLLVVEAAPLVAVVYLRSNETVND